MPKEKCPEGLYKLYKKIYSSSSLVKILQIADIMIVSFSVLTFGFMIYQAFIQSLTSVFLLFVAAGVPFVMVSALRIIVSAPRPYELYDFSDFSDRLPHYKRGQSFPSRHVFSAFLIGTLALGTVTPIGITILCLGVVLGALRYALGIHFLKDIAGGALIGVATGLIGMMIL